MNNRKKEFAEKMRRLNKLLMKENADGVLLTKKSNVAWLGCGADNHVAMGTETGFASFLSMRAENYVITTNIEAGRIAEEEMNELGVKVVEYPWYEEPEKYDLFNGLVKGRTILSDDGFGGTKPLPPDFDALKYQLTPAETERYLILGDQCSQAVEHAVKELRQGDSEHKAAGMLALNLMERGIQPHVILVAADERIDKYRHPIPTEKKIDKRVMLVVCGQKWGLISSLTRLVSFVPLDDELKKKHLAAMQIDTIMNMNTRPGIPIGDIVRKAQSQYEAENFRDEWRLHHQGGPCGYEARYYVAMPDETREVEPNMAFAWNPSVTGTKSEDTVINTPDGLLVVTAAKDWPMVTVETQFGSLERPDILVK